MISAILGLLTSLPRLLDLAHTMWGWLQKISGNDPATFITKVNDAFASLHQAKTEQDMIDAAKKIQDAIKHT